MDTAAKKKLYQATLIFEGDGDFDGRQAMQRTLGVFHMNHVDVVSWGLEELDENASRRLVASNEDASEKDAKLRPHIEAVRAEQKVDLRSKDK